MSLLDHALQQLHQQLEQIARHQRLAAFDRLLHGQDLPALGGDYTAAEWILQALEHISLFHPASRYLPALK